MKKQFFSLLAIGALTLGLASCSNDEPTVGNTPQVGEGEGIGYMSFTITNSNDARSRANDGELTDDNYGPGADITYDGETFNAGDQNEYAIAPNKLANVAIFYDQNGAFYGSSYLSPFNNLDDVDHGATHPDQNGNTYPETFYTYITRWRNTTDDSSYQSKDKPRQVLVLLNMHPDCITDIITAAQGGLTATLEKVGSTTDDHTAYGIYNLAGTQYFSMSNSAYYEADGSLATATKIQDSNICETPEEALKNRVTVYVERMLAKFEVTFGEDNERISSTKDFTFHPFTTNEEQARVYYVPSYTGEEADLDYPKYDINGITWDAYVVNWGINAVERENYYFKNVPDLNPNPFEGENGIWNSANLHRSYWGLSKNYNEYDMDKFPTQFRNTQYDPELGQLGQNFWGTTNATSKEIQTNSNETALSYYSFSHFATRAQYKYAPERTYDAAPVNTLEKGYSGYTPYRYASHILITAQLILNVDGVDANKNATTRGLKDLDDKYYAYGFYWADGDSYLRFAYRNLVTTLCDGRSHTSLATVAGERQVLASDGATFYIDDEGTPLEVKDAQDYFELVPAQMVHGDGKNVISLREGKTLYYQDTEGNYQELDKDVITAFVYTYTDAVQHFNKGMMYYAIPVQHLFGLSDGLYQSKKIDLKDIKRDTQTYKTGQFGTVRNHWYKLNVKTIGSIGIPVDEPDQPIIPDPEDNYNIALEIVVLPWHVINNGSFDL